jgi:hypothetical protein
VAESRRADIGDPRIGEILNEASRPDNVRRNRPPDARGVWRLTQAICDGFDIEPISNQGERHG